MTSPIGPEPTTDRRVLVIPSTGDIPLRSRRAREVARLFGLDRKPRRSKRPTRAMPPVDLPSLVPGAGQIVLLTGPSGAGKSSLLRQLRRHVPGEWIDLNAMSLPSRPVVDCFEGLELDAVLPLLSRVGLAEVWTYLRTPEELSEGQRWRLKLAIAVNAAIQEDRRGHGSMVPDGSRVPARVLAADEFAAVLDRITARIVAHATRKLVTSASGLGAILATSHDDLIAALRPDLIVRCDFGQVEIVRITPVTGLGTGVADRTANGEGS